MNIHGRFLIAAVLALFALGFFANSVVDHYTKPDRPVLTFIVKAAKLGLWLMMFATRKSQKFTFTTTSRPTQQEVLFHIQRVGNERVFTLVANNLFR